MTIPSRSVRVHQFPAHFDKKQTQDLLQTMRREAELERPCFVLDCSHAQNIDERGVFLLLACLEEAMKGNGDVRLASVQPRVAKDLREAGISSLFEMFPTTETAAHSFRKRTNSSTMLTLSEELSEADLIAVA
jgi:anti-anti-sigma factor